MNMKKRSFSFSWTSLSSLGDDSAILYAEAKTVSSSSTAVNVTIAIAIIIIAEADCRFIVAVVDDGKLVISMFLQCVQNRPGTISTHP